MRKKWIIIVMILFIGFFVVTPMLLIRKGTALSSRDFSNEAVNSAPNESFYNGIGLLRSATWFPYFGNEAQNIIDVRTGPFHANYFIEHNNYLMQYSWDEYARLQDECYERYSHGLQSDSLYLCDDIEQTVFKNLNPEDKSIFCEKWKKFQQLLKELNDDGGDWEILESCY